MAESKSESKSTQTVGWAVVTQQVNDDGVAISTTSRTFEGPTTEAAAKKAVEEQLGSNESIVSMQKLEA